MRGFSLLEVLVAITIVAVGVSALAQLVGIATHAQRRATQSTMGAVLAQEKMEELLAEEGGTLASPPDALGRDVGGFADFIDAAGHTMGGSSATPSGSAFLRRWSIESLPDGRNGTWVLQVLVIDLRNRAVTRFTASKSAKAF